ncbi:MAG: polysaccharide biosynthesis protein, partial [Rhodospirillaceae bacterium]|nr:polysaccharide biosynthesis protein [Rhodospirillaceae bacterium]
PSMSIVDIATAMAPNLPQRTVGIRPGEKLHEVMITEDDARNTIALPDRFIIRPTLYPEWCEGYDPLETDLEDGFRYASDNNDQWLDKNSFLSILDSNANLTGRN